MEQKEWRQVTYLQHQLKAANLAAIEASLRHDERIACTNAIVVTDSEGNVTAWFDNSTPVVFTEESWQM